MLEIYIHFNLEIFFRSSNYYNVDIGVSEKTSISILDVNPTLFESTSPCIYPRISIIQGRLKLYRFLNFNHFNLIK